MDISIIIVHDDDLVRKYFGRYQIPFTKIDFSTTVTKYYNFCTGNNLPGYPTFDPNFTTYATLLSKYPYLKAGFDIPEPVLEDLLMNFGNFAKKI